MVRVLIFVGFVTICLGLSSGAAIPAEAARENPALDIITNAESVTLFKSVAEAAGQEPESDPIGKTEAEWGKFFRTIAEAATQESKSDQFKLSGTEGDASKRTKRYVGPALHWLRMREETIHADKAYLDAHPNHAHVPWLDWRRSG